MTAEDEDLMLAGIRALKQEQAALRPRCQLCEQVIGPRSRFCRNHAIGAGKRTTRLHAGSEREWFADTIWAQLSEAEKLAVLQTQTVLLRQGS